MEEKGKILIIDDNEDVLFALNLLLEPYMEQIRVTTQPTRIEHFMTTFHPDVILLDMNFQRDAISGQEGFDYLKQILRIDPQAVVVFMTAYADTGKAVQAIKAGATDFISKPWEKEKLLATLSAAVKLSRSRQEVGRLQNEVQALKGDDRIPELIGNSPAMQKVKETIYKLSDTDANLLILGENGTGKDLAARMLRFFSPRRGQVFIPIDLGSIPEQLFESELFGYEKGAFTDARKAKPGRMETASGGTLFLDEIGNLSLPMQAKLLTAIEKQCITRLGAVNTIHIDVRLICATNANLHQLVAEGKFRQDFIVPHQYRGTSHPSFTGTWRRYSAVSHTFSESVQPEIPQGNQGIDDVKPKTKLLKYEWPGNVRELQHTVERAVILSENGLLKPDDFLFPQGNAAAHQPALTEELNLEKLEKNAIERALKVSAGNMSKAAELLGITRFALYRKLEKWGL